MKKRRQLILLLLSLFFPINLLQAAPPTITEISLPGKPSLRGSAVLKNTLWVTGSGGAVFKSIDAGKNWQEVSPKGFEQSDFRDIELFNKNTAIIMSVGSGEESTLLKTTDGGKNWHRLFQNPDKDGFFDSIDFWDNDNGLMLGDPVDGYYVILKTKDGGKSWQRIARANIPKKLDNEAAFAASGNTLIVQPGGSAWFTTGGFSASVYYSADFGEHWQRITVPIHRQTATSGGYALGTNQEGNIFVVGGDYRERDGQYPNMASVSKLDNQLSANWIEGQKEGLRTALSCTQHFCISSGKLQTDWSGDQGQHWQMLRQSGVYTLAASTDLMLGAGSDGRVWIIQ